MSRLSRDLSKLSSESIQQEIKDTDDLVETIIGERPRIITIDVLPKLIAYLKEEGYQMVTVPELNKNSLNKAFPIAHKTVN